MKTTFMNLLVLAILFAPSCACFANKPVDADAFNRAVDEIERLYKAGSSLQVLRRVKPLLDRIQQRRAAMIEEALPGYDLGWELLSHHNFCQRYAIRPAPDSETGESGSYYHSMIVMRRLSDFVRVHIKECPLLDGTLNRVKAALKADQTRDQSRQIVTIQGRKALIEINYDLRDARLFMPLAQGNALLCAACTTAVNPNDLLTGFAINLDIVAVEKALNRRKKDYNPNRELNELFQEIKDAFDLLELGRTASLIEACAQGALGILDLNKGGPLPFSGKGWQMMNTVPDDMFLQYSLWTRSLSYQKGAGAMMDGASSPGDVHMQIIYAPESPENRHLQERLSSRQLGANEKIQSIDGYPALIDALGNIRLLLCQGEVRVVIYNPKDKGEDGDMESLIGMFDIKALEQDLCAGMKQTGKSK